MPEWAGETFVKLTEIQAWQELVFVFSSMSNIESREKASKLSFWWSDDNLWKNMLCCVYILTYRHFMLHRTINYIISVLVTALMTEHTKK